MGGSTKTDVFFDCSTLTAGHFGTSGSSETLCTSFERSNQALFGFNELKGMAALLPSPRLFRKRPFYTYKPQKVGLFCKRLYVRFFNFPLLLTDDLELHEITSNWLGVDLTLVSTRISFLNVLYLQNPLVTSHVVDGSEAHVCCVGITANCQDVQVMMPNPGHLQRNKSIPK